MLNLLVNSFLVVRVDTLTTCNEKYKKSEGKIACFGLNNFKLMVIPGRHKTFAHLGCPEAVGLPGNRERQVENRAIHCQAQGGSQHTPHHMRRSCPAGDDLHQQRTRVGSLRAASCISRRQCLPDGTAGDLMHVQEGPEERRNQPSTLTEAIPISRITCELV